MSDSCSDGGIHLLLGFFWSKLSFHYYVEPCSPLGTAGVCNPKHPITLWMLPPFFIQHLLHECYCKGTMRHSSLIVLGMRNERAVTPWRHYGQKNHGMSNKTLSILLLQPSLWLFIHPGCSFQDMSSHHDSSQCWHFVPCHQPLWPVPTQAAGQAEVQPAISLSIAASLGVTCTKRNGSAILCSLMQLAQENLTLRARLARIDVSVML